MCTWESTHERNSTSVWSATRRLVGPQVLVFIWESTQQTNHTNVKCVTRHSVRSQIWTIMQESTQETNHTNVKSATRHFARSRIWTITWEYTQVTSHTNVSCARRHFARSRTWTITWEFTQGINHTNVKHVTRHFARSQVWILTWRSTQEISQTNIKCVSRHLVLPQLWALTWESKCKTNHTSVYCVTKVLITQEDYRSTNNVNTSIEDFTTVLTVECSLWECTKWIIMSVFTLVQSHTHVHIVQTVLLIIANSKHICWSHTMKVLGLYVMSVRRSSASLDHIGTIYVVMKVWSHMFAVNVQRVSVQNLSWNLISWSTLTSSVFAVVHVGNISNVNIALNHTSGSVPINWDSVFPCKGRKHITSFVTAGLWRWWWWWWWWWWQFCCLGIQVGLLRLAGMFVLFARCDNWCNMLHITPAI